MGSIPSLSGPMHGYVRAGDLAAIALTRDGRIISTRNPAGTAMAWWLSAVDVGPVINVLATLSQR